MAFPSSRGDEKETQRLFVNVQNESGFNSLIFIDSAIDAY